MVKENFAPLSAASTPTQGGKYKVNPIEKRRRF